MRSALSFALLLGASEAAAQGRGFRCTDLPEGQREELVETQVEPRLVWSPEAEPEVRAWLDDLRRHHVQWALRRCYRQMVVRSPRLEGVIRFNVAIEPDGAMRVVAAVGADALAPLRAYLIERVARARARPAGQRRLLRLTVRFVPPPDGVALRDAVVRPAPPAPDRR